MSDTSHKIAIQVAVLLSIVLVALLATVDLWGNFPLFGHSARIDFFRQATLHHCLSEGLLFPRFIPDAYFGYGSPLFHFYAPLSYYLTELPILFGAEISVAIKITMALALLLSGLTMYLFCRDFAGPIGSCLAAVAYMLAPYHLADMLVRHAMGEHLAFVFLPLAAWGLTGMMYNRPPVRLLVGTLALAALILSHNIASMLGFAVLLLWGGILSWQVRERRCVTWGAGLLFWGLALAAFFWLPVLADKHLILGDRILTGGFYDFHKHFVLFKQLLQPSWGYGGSVPGENDAMSFQVGIPHWLFVLGGLIAASIAWLRNHRRLPWLLFALILFFVSIFMTLSLSEPIYRLFPLLPYIQFPWRFLLFAVFGSSLLATILEIPLNRLPRPVYTFSGGLFVILLILFFYLPYAKPAAYLYADQAQKFVAVSPARFQALLESGNYRSIQELGGLAYLRTTGTGGSDIDDFLPRWVDPAHLPQGIPAERVTWEDSEEGKIRWRNEGPLDLSATVTANQPATVEFARFYFPGWQGWVNGKRVAIHPHPERGTILLPVATGTSEVSIRFGSTPLRTFSGLISLLALAAIFGFPILRRIFPARKLN